MARVPDPVWQPPSVPWATKKSVWVDDGDGGTDEVSVHSPRLQRASKETGVPLSEVAVRKKASFKEHGLRRKVVATRFQMFEQRRMEKLWLLVRRRARLVQVEERAKELAKEKAKDFQVEAPPAGAGGGDHRRRRSRTRDAQRYAQRGGDRGPGSGGGDLRRGAPRGGGSADRV